MLIDIDLLFRTEGLRPLLQTLVEGPHELSPTLASAFLYLVDAPRTRVYFNPGLDLEVPPLPGSPIPFFNSIPQIALTGFTDSYGGKGGAHAERMQASSKVIATMLRSWSGKHFVTYIKHWTQFCLQVSCICAMMGWYPFVPSSICFAFLHWRQRIEYDEIPLVVTVAHSQTGSHP